MHRGGEEQMGCWPTGDHPSRSKDAVRTRGEEKLPRVPSHGRTDDIPVAPSCRHYNAMGYPLLQPSMWDAPA